MNSFTTPVFYQRTQADLVWAQLPYFTPDQTRPDQTRVREIFSDLVKLRCLSGFISREYLCF